MRIESGLAALAMALTASAAAAQVPRLPDSAIAGPRSQVLVLGTPHLSGLPDSFRAENLALLLDRLAAWHPDVITIESVSGSQCDFLRRYRATYPNSAATYCWDPEPARLATGLDVPAAVVEVERRLAAWPAAPAAADRRHLAALFLAAGDRGSALVQWLRLPPAERHAGDGLDAALVAVVERARTGRNEDYAIAATLAARLGQERIFPVDDHSSDDASGDDPGFEAAMTRIWHNSAIARRLAANTTVEAASVTPAGVLAMYRYYNAPGQRRIVFDSDFGAALADRTPHLLGRRYVGGWETRNLRMVANIRAVLASRPGARVLAIVGASHKGYFEAYLAQLHDVAVADTTPVLR